jgi:serine protease Do
MPLPASVKALGLALTPLTPALREKYRLGDAGSVVVTEVTKGSPAGDRDLKPGDVILEIDHRDVKSPDDIPKRVEEAAKSGRKSILLLVERGGDPRFVALRIDRGG